MDKNIMKRIAATIVLVGLGGAPAIAEETPVWTASASIDTSRTEGQGGEDEQSSQSGAFSLSRQFETFELGGSIGGSGDDTKIPEGAAVLSASSFNGALWWGSNFGPLDVRLAGSFGRQDLDAGVINSAQTGSRSRLPASFRAATVYVEGGRKTLGVAIDVSHTFTGAVSVTPYASVGVDRTKTKVSAALDPARSSAVEVSDSEEGVTGAFGVILGRDLGERATLSFSAAANATDNAAARTLSRSGEGLTQRGQSQSGAEQWAGFGVGLNLQATPSVALGFNISGTAGREEDDFVGGLSVSRSF